MYKTVDIANVMGSALYNQEKQMSSFPLVKIYGVIDRVVQEDRFVRIDRSHSAYARVEELAKHGVVINDVEIHLRKPTDVKDRFVKTFFSLDAGTQEMLDKIVKEVFNNE